MKWQSGSRDLVWLSSSLAQNPFVIFCLEIQGSGRFVGVGGNLPSLDWNPWSVTSYLTARHAAGCSGVAYAVKKAGTENPHEPP